MSDTKVFNAEEKKKLTHLINEGVRVLDEVSILKGGLSDTVKAISEEMEISASVLNKAIRVASKANFDQATTEFELLENILATTGRDI